VTSRTKFHTKPEGIFRDNQADYQIWVNLGDIIPWNLFSQCYIITLNYYNYIITLHYYIVTLLHYYVVTLLHCYIITLLHYRDADKCVLLAHALTVRACLTSGHCAGPFLS